MGYFVNDPNGMSRSFPRVTGPEIPLGELYLIPVTLRSGVHAVVMPQAVSFSLTVYWSNFVVFSFRMVHAVYVIIKISASRPRVDRPARCHPVVATLNNMSNFKAWHRQP